ncbi:MAG: alpha-N-acetylglucosaminidase [Phycisphaerales bacterium]|nr:MAG: alpha-N-acetylglucosaminidase [Phycisphaerales bacterium]
MKTHMPCLALVMLLLLGPGVLPPAFAGTQSDSAASAAARGLLDRLFPESPQKDAVVFVAIPDEGLQDCFEIETRDGKVIIGGNNAISMAVGLNWYLKYSCHCHVSFRGRQLNLPEPLPTVATKVRRTAWAKKRYFLNYCCFGYSLAFWDFEQWEELIDWMALNGINAPLSVTGAEAVWQAVCRQLGMTEAEIAEFLAGPPYLPFQWMGCLDGWGGPLPQAWIAQHEQLGRRILARQRELGMTPVLQGFTGHVPAVVARKTPDATAYKVEWLEWQTHLMDPLSPQFGEIARLWMTEQQKRFGSDHLYAADTFIEMVPPSGDLKYLADLSRAIYSGMAASDPEAVWVLQGWAFMYKRQFWTQPRFQAFLAAIDDERMLVLDLFCESTPMWNVTDAFCGKPWLWCNIQTFGCKVNMGGALDKIVSDLYSARRDPNRGQLAGLGFVNEGLDYNPVVFDLLYECAWRDEPVDVAAWLDQYSDHRYGAADPEARQAWRLLYTYVYNKRQSGGSVIVAKPTLEPHSPITDAAKIAAAWEHLLNAADQFGSIDTYRFDLVQVARHCLASYASELQHQMAAAFHERDLAAFEQVSQRFLDLLRNIDALLATREDFLLGRWLEDAKRWGATEAEKARMEWNARRVLTLWGETPVIDDYAHKEWSGMISGFYLPRWERALRQATEDLGVGRAFDPLAFDENIRPWMKQWSSRQDTYPNRPHGDTVAVAQRLWKKYRPALRP